MASRREKILAESKLTSSGLTFKDAKVLNITSVSPTQIKSLPVPQLEAPALKIDYYTPDGKPLQDCPCSEPYYRLRYLDQPAGFEDQTKAKKLRYVQPSKTLPVVYYPQNYKDWPALCANPKEKLIITEGELKAAKACKEGFPTLGLGGVHSWKTVEKGVPWLPSLEWVDWLRRKVYICFDSDYRTNQHVCHALRLLAEELQARGAFPYIITLPTIPDFGDKVGLDDFLTFGGPGAKDAFQQMIASAMPLGLSAALWEFNARYVYIRNPGLIIDSHDMSNKISPAAFKDHLEISKQYYEATLGNDGEVDYKPVPAAPAWLKWPLRKEAACLTYKPGADRFVHTNGNTTLAQPMLNTWPGWGVEPKRGSVKPFLKLVDHLFDGAEKEAKDWFLRWCAYPLQNPGTKQFVSVVIHGIRHGTGKSLVGYTLGKIYGRNFTEINQMDLHNNFNEWAESKQFVMGDDVTGSNKRKDADFLKKMITQKELRINAKFTPTYVVPDCINYFFTSQHPDSFFLEDDDRRFFIHEVVVGPRSNDFYQQYMTWLDEGGAEAVFYYLLNLKMNGFNPSAAAYRTAAKERMIDTGRSELASWVRLLIAVPDNVLRVGHVVIERDLFTSKELLAYYDPTGSRGVTANGLGRELSRAGIRQVCQGKPVRLKDGSQGRYYAIRDPHKWLRKSMREVTRYLNEQPDDLTGSRF